MRTVPRTRLAVALPTVVAAIALSCSASSEVFTPLPTSIASSTPEMSLSASWAEYYPDLPSLFDAATIVVLARVIDASEVDPTTVSGGPASVDPRDWIPFTRFELEVEEAIAGDAPNRIAVGQTGARTDGDVAEIADDPLLEVGALYLLFLRYASDSELHVILGGPQGRFVVAGDEVNALSVHYPERNISDTAIAGLPLEAVRALVP